MGFKKYKNILLVVMAIVSAIFMYYQNGKIDELQNLQGQIDTTYIQGDIQVDTVTVTKEVIKVKTKIDTVSQDVFIEIPTYDTTFVEYLDTLPRSVTFADSSNKFVDLSGKVILPPWKIDTRSETPFYSGKAGVVLNYTNKFDLRAYDERFRAYGGIAYLNNENKKQIALYTMTTYKKYNLGVLFNGDYTGAFIGRRF